MDDDIDYAALFGVTPEDGDDVSNSDTGPAREPGQDAGTEQEPAVSAPEGGDNVSNSDTAQEREEGQEPAQENVPDSDTAQRTDQNVSNLDTKPAAVPNETAVAKARAEAQRAIDEVFARSGLRNPYTGQPITTKAEYDAYRERFEAERREQVMKKTGMSGEEFQQFVQDLPEVRKAREAQEAAERAQREAREAAARVKVEEQVKEIGALDPSIKSLADLAKMPTYPKFYELVQRGNTLTDAFKLANYDTLTQRAAAGARQAAVNTVRSKEHLAQTQSRGTGVVSVPAEVREQYKLFNPDATEEEIQKHYQKNHKE